MVLSNKKLKQKLRDAMADSAAAPPVVDTLGGRADQVESMERKLGDGAHRLNLSKREKRRKVGGDGGGSGGDVLKSGKRKRWEGKSAGGEGGEMVVEAGAGSARRMKGKRKMEAVGIVDLLGSVRKLKSEKEKKEWKKGKSAGGEGGEMVVEAGAGSVRSKKGKRKMEAVGIVDLLGSVRKLKSEKEKKEWKKKKNRAGKKKKEKVGDKENRNGETGLIVVDHVDASGGNGATNKVYVGGIPYYSTEDDIRSFFESCGTISEVDCMSFPESGKFRGIAIITFKTDAAAKRALDLDGADMGGLFLKIQPYRATRVQRSQPKPTDFSPKIIDGYNRIYVGNLSWEVTEDDLRKFFCDCSISSIRFGMDKETGEFRGYAHIDFSDDDSLLIALALDERVVCGRPARIRCAVPLKATKIQGVASKDLLAKENGKSSSNQKKKRRTCYQCGIPGHLSSSCPNKSETPTLPV